MLKVSNFTVSQTLILCKVKENGQSVINTVSVSSVFHPLVHINAGEGKGRKTSIVVELVLNIFLD